MQTASGQSASFGKSTPAETILPAEITGINEANPFHPSNRCRAWLMRKGGFCRFCLTCEQLAAIS